MCLCTALVGIEPRTSRSGIKGSTTRSPCSPLQVMRTCINVWMSSYFGQFSLRTPELSALERLKNLCIMLIPLFCAFIFDRIFVLLAGKEDSHYRAWMSSNFCQIHSWTAELAALESLKNLHRLTIIFGTNVVTTLAPSILMDLLKTCNLQGQQYKHR